MAWYQEEERKGGGNDQILERFNMRIAKLVVENLDAVRAEKPVHPAWVDMQALYKAHLYSLGGGLERTPSSFVRAVLRAKIGKGLLRASSSPYGLIPSHARHMHEEYVKLQELASKLRSQAEAPVGPEFVLSAAVLESCENLMQGILELDRLFGDSLESASELGETDKERASKIVADSAKVIHDHAAILRKAAEILAREVAYEARAVHDVPLVAEQESLVRSFVVEVQHMSNRVSEQAAGASSQAVS